MKAWIFYLWLIFVSVSCRHHCRFKLMSRCERVKKVIHFTEFNACHGGGKDVNTEGSYLAQAGEKTRIGETVRIIRRLMKLRFHEFADCLKGKYSRSNLCKEEKVYCGPSDSYQTYDGTCNNVEHPKWGSVGTEQVRLLDPVFDDGYNSPRMKDKYGISLPNVRKISNAVFTKDDDDADRDEDPEFTSLVMTMSQLADHDITMTPTIKDKDGQNINCCTNPNHDCHSVCLPIKIARDDPYLSKTGQRCINLVRSVSSPCCSEDCKRTPINVISAYLDGNPTYGNSNEQAAEFREKDGKGAKLKVADFTLEGTYLPRNKNQENACLDGSKTVPFCMVSGDTRHHVVGSLVSIITLFHREHNRIVDKLQALHNPGWDDERLYQEARKIVIAEYQSITIRDLIAGVVLDDEIAKEYHLKEKPGYDNVYDEDLNAQTSLVFSTAGFRFGHTLINSLLGQCDKTNTHDIVNVPVHLNYNRVHICFMKSGISGILRYISQRGMGKADGHMHDTVRNLLFFDSSNNKSLDLGALNIMRGRDHGLPPYNKWRKMFGLPPFPASHTPSMAARIREVYGDRDDEIDVFAGGLTEIKRKGALVGDLFAHIIGEQFLRLKYGDRFYYQNKPDGQTSKGRFKTEAQVKSIQKISLARMLCENTETTQIQPNVFKRVRDGNKLVSCSDYHTIPDINFNLWKEN